MRKVLAFLQKNSLISSILGSLIGIGLLRIAGVFLKLNLRIIDFIFIFLILFVVIMLIVVYKRQKSIPVSSDKGQLREDFENHRKGYKKFVEETDKNIRQLRQDLSRIYDKAKKYEEIEIKKEIISILEIIGATKNRVIDKDNNLFWSYQKKLNYDLDETQLNLNINTNFLVKEGLIRLIKNKEEDFFEITEKGLEYLRIAKMKIAEEEKEKGGNS